MRDVTIRIPGRRSRGGIVKRGKGGWSISWYEGFRLSIDYIDPDTGNAASTDTFLRHPVQAVRWCKATTAKSNIRRHPARV